MKLKKTVWIPLVCSPVLLTAIIVPPVVIYKNKQIVNKPIDNKKPISDKQPKKPTPQPTKPIDELKPIIDPNITTLNNQLKEVSTSLNSMLSNKKYKNLEKLQSEISAHLTNNNNSFNNISFEITNKSRLPKHARNQTVNLNLKATGLNNKSSSLSTTLNNVSLGILDIDEIISRKKLWVEIKELESFKNSYNSDQVKEDFFYLLKKNNYDNLDESIFNKNSYTYDFSQTEVKNVNVDYHSEQKYGEKYYYKKSKFSGMKPTESWYKTKMKIKKNRTKDDFVDWNNKDELELTLYAFIPELYETNKFFRNSVDVDDGDFIAIDKNGNEKRIYIDELTNNWYKLSPNTFDYKSIKQKGWIVEELVSWNGFKIGTLPETIKRVPKYLKMWSLRRTFYGASKFNQDISTWDTKNVDDMRYIFSGATSFSQDLSKWDTSNVEKSNQDIDVSNTNWKKEHWPQFNKKSS
ncbi:BspA family leucine-rich repeat surface protein [Mycoplasma capricolum]|uniref:PARCEL domain-containing protein n=1 Tax=Mycoplasma capricolum subsp. capricolum 14232 TaxID=1188238 RepID=A0A084EJ55_MYCCA|nr:BspA family leucine-rich repeat surface protein [Mycoplasma capricolum]KEZ17997.1 Hypothetical protein, predicted transmembrane protein, DUF285 family [Mycoplasma capricolum subsp. capricolum 14232]